MAKGNEALNESLQRLVRKNANLLNKKRFFDKEQNSYMSMFSPYYTFEDEKNFEAKTPRINYKNFRQFVGVNDTNSNSNTKRQEVDEEKDVAVTGGREENTSNKEPNTPKIKTNKYKIKPVNTKKKYEPTIQNIISFFESNNEGGDLNIQNNLAVDNQALETRLGYQDFVYCRDLDVYPNNRMMILRKYEDAVPDDLFNYIPSSGNARKENPLLSTMVSWFNNLNDVLTISFEEKWKDYNGNGIVKELNEIAGEIAEKSTGNSTVTSAVIRKAKSIIETAQENPFAKAIFYDALASQLKDKRENGNLKQPFFDYTQVFPEGHPGFVRKSSWKQPGDSLTSSIEVKFTASYELRYINGIDPHVAFFDLISNAMRMNHQNSVFSLPLNNIEGFEALNRGNFIDGFNAFVNFISDITKNVAGKVRETLNILDTTTGIDDNTEAVTEEGTYGTEDLKDFAKGVFSSYRLRLQAAVKASTGEPSGSYHITIGNPMNPIMAIGDLVPNGNTQITFNNELSYDDFPTQFTVNYSLKTARSKGLEEIESMFNAGRGRIYHYKFDSYDPLHPQNFWRDHNKKDEEEESDNQSIDTGSGGFFTGSV